MLVVLVPEATCCSKTFLLRTRKSLISNQLCHSSCFSSSYKNDIYFVCLQIVHPRLCLCDWEILLLDPRFLFKFDVLFMLLNELGSYLLSIVKVPQFFQFFCLLFTFDLLLYKLNSIYKGRNRSAINTMLLTLVVLKNLWTNNLIDSICWHLIDQVP